MYTYGGTGKSNTGEVNVGSENMETIEYHLKNASRPNIKINQEDVNYYGYRTKVATRTDFGTIKLTFYEDSVNVANDFLWAYMFYVSPIVSVNAENIGEIMDTSADSVDNHIGNLKYQSFGALNRADGQIMWMKVCHHYTDYSNQSSAKHRMTTYTYMNPKVESIEADDLDMTSSEASTISVTFTVDGVYVTDSLAPPIPTGNPVAQLPQGMGIFPPQAPNPFDLPDQAKVLDNPGMAPDALSPDFNKSSNPFGAFDPSGLSSPPTPAPVSPNIPSFIFPD
jgi:hypothetical protein